VDRDKRPRRRLRALLPRETGPRTPRRRSLARTEQEPEPEVEAEYDGWESVRLRYSQWGCSAPPPPERKD
jgi:hypothetical protein